MSTFQMVLPNSNEFENLTQIPNLNQNHSILKFEQILNEFKLKPNLIWIPFEIILRKIEKFTVSVGCTGAHSHSGLLGHGPVSWPNPVAFDQPTTHGAWPVCTHHALGVRSTRPSASSGRGMMRCPMARWRFIDNKVYTTTILTTPATSRNTKT
jgi:hypothetical protein